MYYVYLIKFPNNKKYIGITNNMRKRKKSHRCKYLKYKSHQPILYDAIKEFGWDKLYWKILSVSSNLQSIRLLEKIYIKKYKSNNLLFGYNMNSGGSGAGTLTKEARTKISLAHSGRKLTQQHKNNISKSNSGKKFSIDHRNNISKSKKGIKPSIETILKSSISRTGLKRNRNAIEKMIKTKRINGVKNSKLNPTKVLEIRSLYATGKYTQKELSILFYISRSVIGRVINKIDWAHI